MGWVAGVICALTACAVDPVQQIAGAGPAAGPSPPTMPTPLPGVRALSATAIDAFALAADSSLILAYLYKGGIFNRMERYEEALECYEQALRAQEKR